MSFHAVSALTTRRVIGKQKNPVCTEKLRRRDFFKSRVAEPTTLKLVLIKYGMRHKLKSKPIIPQAQIFYAAMVGLLTYSCPTAPSQRMIRQ